MIPLLPALTLLLVAPAPAGERIGVIAVHDPTSPDGELSELTHQLRAACTERVAGVIPATEMRARMSGKTGGATIAELDRAFGGALAVYQNGENDSAVRTLKAIIDDLEELPESEAVWNQWTRAMMRLSHVYLTMKQPEELEAVQTAVLKADSSLQLDPVLYAPGFRARFDELRQRVRAMPKRRLTVTARGRAGTIFVGGRDVGLTPATVIVPAGVYRVAGVSGALRIPSFTVDLGAEDRSVVLDFALAEAFRTSAGPGLVLGAAERQAGIVRTGAWLGVERLVVASRAAEGEALFLVGSIYDVRRGALLREGSVRLVSGGVPAANLGALATFLLTGQSSREVQDRGREPRPKVAPVASPAAPGGPPRAAASAAPAPAASGLAAGPGRAPAGPQAPPIAAAAPVTAPQPSPMVTAPPAIQIARPVMPPAASSVASPAAPLLLATTPGAAAPTTRAAPPEAPAVTAPSSQPPAVEPSRAPAVAAAAPPPDLHPSPSPAPTPLSAEALRTPLPPPPPGWMRPTALGSGLLGAALAVLAVQQGLNARDAYAQADRMVANGVYQPGATPAGRAAALDRGDAAARNGWVAGGSAVVAVGAAAILTWMSRDPGPPR